MTTEATGTRSRRSVIAAGLAGIGALAATALGRPVAASTAGPGDPILAGKGAIVGENTADVPTIVNTTTSNGDVLRAMAPGTGVALRGTSGFGTGVIGTAGDTSGMATALTENGVYGYSSISDNSVGVWGDGPYGLYGTGDVGRLADGGIGVLAFGSVGVWADVGPGNTGVYGFVGSGAAPAPAANVAVQATAQTTSQVALKVSGRVQFSRSGRTSIGATATSKAVSLAGVTSTSLVIGVLQSNRSGVFVRAILPAAGKFTIYLS